MMDQAEQLRKMVQEAEQGKEPEARVITVTSGKGGVGKTNISLNLAIQLSKLGKRVVVFDADFGLANIEIMLGARPKYNLADLMFRGKELKDIICESEMGISFISGGSGVQEMAAMSRDQVMYLTSKLVELDNYADVIIVDTGAGISDSVLEFVMSSSEVLLVATPEPTSITDAYSLLKALNKKAEFSREETVIKMVSNRVKNEAEGKSLYEKMKVVSDKFLGIPLEYGGHVPMDDLVPKSVIRQKPFSVLYPDAAPSRAVRQMAERILEIESTDARERWGISKMFSNLIRNKLKKSV